MVAFCIMLVLSACIMNFHSCVLVSYTEKMTKKPLLCLYDEFIGCYGFDVC